MAGYKPTKSDLEDQVKVLQAALDKSKASNDRKRQRLLDASEGDQETEDRLRADRNHYRSMARQLEGFNEEAEAALADARHELQVACALVGSVMLEQTLAEAEGISIA